jgi:phosphatidylglycerol lysyltransferase
MNSFSAFRDGACAAARSAGGSSDDAVHAAVGEPKPAEVAIVEVPHDGRKIFFGRRLAEGDRVPPDAYVVGEEPWWELDRWDDVVRRSASLRSQLRRAKHHGVVARVVRSAEFQPGKTLRQQLDCLIDAWLHARKLPPLRFSATVAPFKQSERVVVVAEQRGRLLAAAFARPLQPGSTAIVDHIVRAATTPNGTTELLVDAAFRLLSAEGYASVTLGLCALHGRVPTPLQWARRPCRILYDFNGIAAFRSRLRPHCWARILVEYPRRHALSATLHVLREFAGGDLLRFTWDSLLHVVARTTGLGREESGRRLVDR